MLIPVAQLTISDEVVNRSFDNRQISAQVLATHYPPSCYQTMEGNIFQTKIFLVSNDVHNANELVFLSKKMVAWRSERDWHLLFDVPDDGPPRICRGLTPL